MDSIHAACVCTLVSYMQLVELASGCVCCSIGDEGGVEASVRKLLQQGSWDHIVLEASGVADTSSLATSIGTMRLEGAAWLASVVVVVDAQAFASSDSYGNARTPERQIGAADLVVLSKCDLMDDGSGIDHVEDVEESLRARIGRDVPILRSAKGHMHAAAILDVPRERRAHSSGDDINGSDDKTHASHRPRPPLLAGLRRPTNIEDDGIASVSCPSSAPCDVGKLQAFLARGLPRGLLRAKGFVSLASGGAHTATAHAQNSKKDIDDDIILEVQVSGRRNLLMAVHSRRVSEPKEMAIVFIGIGLDTRRLSETFASVSVPSHDTAYGGTCNANIEPVTHDMSPLARFLEMKLHDDARFVLKSTAESAMKASILAFNLIAAPWSRDENNAVNLALVNEINSSHGVARETPHRERIAGGIIVLPARDDAGDLCVLYDASQATLSEIDDPDAVWNAIRVGAERTLAAAFMSNYCCGRCPF